jgi:predicted AAA+ superfamily ATPase
MSLKPWREIAQPHKDVLEGTFKQSEFAADISQVATGTANEEYQDAQKFFSRTFITEGMRLLLMSVAQRLSGKGGDPVIQLQTAFGGGKTHTMLAVFHLASRKVSADKLEGIPPILDEADICDLPNAKVAVIDGIKLSPSQPQQHGEKIVNTLWGELAWQLLGDEGYDMVAQSDEDGTSPGKEVIRQILDKAAPCVILIDELVAFVRQLEVGKQFKAGTFDSNISFIQALTEAMKAVPNAILLASLPESELEVGGTMGQRALESLEKYFARIESVWKPVASTEAFEIVRRRLFESAGDLAEVQGISRQFSDFYRSNSEKFPTDTQSNVYFERLCQSYPIHPEVFDRLYEDWSTLDKFQRTRGVLQYMAIVIHRLWNSDNKDALIMPGSIPLDDSNVRNKSIHYLPQGWEPVLEKEVDGQRSEPADIDGRDTRFGGVQAARRAMRTIFLGSAPSNAEQGVKGLNHEHILLGCVQPGQTVGVFEDVLKRLRDRLHYLYSEQDRYYLDTRPNLRREMESRKQNINEIEELHPLLKERVTGVFGRNHCFGGIHVFTPSVDVPDDFAPGPRLVVLPPSAAYSRGDSRLAIEAAEEILRNRGEQPRQKQNRLIFFAADYDVVSRLKDAGRTYLAWKSIVSDVSDGKLDLTVSLSNQAKRNADGAEQGLQQIVRETYKWIICPQEEFVKGKPELSWESVSVSPAAQNLVAEIENTLREEEWLISEWSPIHLRNMLQKWYFKDGVSDIGALKVWQDSCHYLYLPRLVNDHVYKDAINSGLGSDDYFGFASGKDGDRYLGFVFGRGSMSMLDDASLLIDRDTAADYRERTKPAPVPSPDPVVTPGGTPVEPSPDPVDTRPIQPQVETVAKTQFYGSLNLDPVKAKMDFSNVVDEVVQQFTSKLGVEVSISIEIQAKFKDGFDESLQRTIKENCNVLGFTSSEFEEG